MNNKLLETYKNLKQKANKLNQTLVSKKLKRENGGTILNQTEISLIK